MGGQRSPSLHPPLPPPQKQRHHRYSTGSSTIASQRRLSSASSILAFDVDEDDEDEANDDVNGGDLDEDEFHRSIERQRQQRQHDHPRQFRGDRQRGGGGEMSFEDSSSTLLRPVSTVSLGDFASLRVPIVGFETMEKRARFTVFKVRVIKGNTQACKE